jgi:hypothetical protein
VRTRVVAIVLIALCLVSSALLVTNASSQTNKKWLYLLYLDADNSLDVKANNVWVVQSDLDELMSVGSTDQVTCYVLVDRVAGPANLLKIEKGSMEEIANPDLNGKEINMGDPATLRSFVTYAMDASPADHALLIFWDHGSLRYAAFDEHASDAGGSDSLSHFEVCQALSGLKVDVIAADECNVGQIEVAYQYALNTQTEYLVAAETYTGWRGFPYDATLREMTTNPDMTAREAAIMMIDQTQLLLNKPPYMGERINSHAAIDLAKVVDLVGSLKGLTDIMTPDIKDYANLVSKARGAAQYCYGANAANKLDLRMFVQTISAKTSSEEIQNACMAVLDDFDTTVVALHATRSLNNMVFGLGITFVDHMKEWPGYYDEFAFANQGWMDFVSAYDGVHGSA